MLNEAIELYYLMRFLHNRFSVQFHSGISQMMIDVIPATERRCPFCGKPC
jgi:hypothetical protein